MASLDFDIRVHLADITQSPLVQNEVRFAVIHRFKEEGIETPYPKTDAMVARDAAARETCSVGVTQAQTAALQTGQKLNIPFRWRSGR